MVRLNGKIKSKVSKKKPLRRRIKQKANIRKKPLLSRKGVTQTIYEAGFFEFLKIFWNNNQRTEICSLIKQAANAWEALLPKPRHSKKQIIKDYDQEFRAIQKEAKEAIRKNRLGRDERGEESIDQTGTEEDESQIDDNDESVSEHTSNRGSGSEDESDNDSESSRGKKRKQTERRVDNNENSERNKKIKSDQNNNETDQQNSTQNSNKKIEGTSKQNTEDGIFFPIREETSYDRIVIDDHNNRQEMLRKIHGSETDLNCPDQGEMKSASRSSISSQIEIPRVPSESSDNPISPKLSDPTDTLHVKNLVVDIRQPELQEIFKMFLNDIVLIRVLDNKLNGEAVIEFKSIEAAENVWKQMNGVEYKRLPLVLEFANKEDLLY